MILQKMGGYSNFENIVGFYNRLFFEISNSLMFGKEQLYFEPGATVTSTSFSW